MAAIILPYKWRRQPPQAMVIDQANPLSKGLIGCMYQCGSITLDGLANTPATRTGTGLARATFKDGIACTTASEASFLDAVRPLPAINTTTGGLTLFCLSYSTDTATANNKRVCSFRTSGSTVMSIDHGAVGGQTGNIVVSVQKTSAQFPIAYQNAAFTAGRVYAITGTIAVGTALVPRIFVDGVEPAFTNTASDANALVGTPTIHRMLSVSAASTGNYLRGGAFITLGWGRGLNANEILSISENPWQLFRMRKNIRGVF
jgi:drug/metabolite transporter superfamily protein YnfA